MKSGCRGTLEHTWEPVDPDKREKQKRLKDLDKAPNCNQQIRSEEINYLVGRCLRRFALKVNIHEFNTNDIFHPPSAIPLYTHPHMMGPPPITIKVNVKGSGRCTKVYQIKWKRLTGWVSQYIGSYFWTFQHPLPFRSCLPKWKQLDYFSLLHPHNEFGIKDLLH